MDDFQITEDDIAAGYVEVPVKAHFDCYVSAWDVQIYLPEGLYMDGDADPGSDLNLTWYNSRGKATPFQATLNQNSAYQGDIRDTRFIVANTQTTYEQVDGSWVEMGAVQWGPGDYEEMWIMYFAFDEDFQGGDITVTTKPSTSGWGDGSMDCPAGQVNVHTTTVTVAGADNPLPLPGNITVSEPDENGVVTISYNGTEDVTIVVTVNGETVELVDGTVQLAEGDNIIVVTVSAEGYEDKTETFEVNWTAPTPEPTATPVITYTEGEDAYIVTVTGNGDVHMYVNGDEVEFPYTIARDEVDVTYTITATAQEEGKPISETAELILTVPAKEVGPGPDDPHMTGYWIIIFDQNNNENWYPLYPSANNPNNYVNMVTLEFDPWGTFNPVYGERPNVPFYFMINGERYGAEVENQPTAMGDFSQTIQNPLFLDSEFYYTVPVGFTYTIGVQTNNEGELYVLCSQGDATGIDELANGKNVAGVRYFNMAGQEMQEVNGMTIVVTTYTDGTTSAVKVMK